MTIPIIVVTGIHRRVAIAAEAMTIPIITIITLPPVTVISTPTDSLSTESMC